MVGKAEAGTPESISTGYHMRATFLHANSQDPVRAQMLVTTVTCQANWSGYPFPALYYSPLNTAEDQNMSPP